MLWSVVLIWLGAQIAFKAFKHKKGIEAKAKAEKRRRREFKALYRVS